MSTAIERMPIYTIVRERVNKLNLEIERNHTIPFLIRNSHPFRFDGKTVKFLGFSIADIADVRNVTSESELRRRANDVLDVIKSVVV